MDRNFDGFLDQAGWAVRRWAEFPVCASPRPVVLVGGEVLKPGFRTTEAKIAFSAGRIDWAVEVPDVIRRALQVGAAGWARKMSGGPLKITHAGTGGQEFATDRGPKQLPAWWVEGPQTLGPIWVLDPAVNHWEPREDAAGPPPPVPVRAPATWGPVQLHPDGQSLVISWLGSHTYVETFPRAELIETPVAVSAVAVRRDMGYEGWVTAVGVRHEISARLSEPLGNRVFVDLLGSAVQVLASR